MKQIGPKTRIKLALAKVDKEIMENAKSGGRFAGGLAGEGFAGGYACALRDIELLLRGVEPCGRPEYWN
jgi:hypothetical protein